ncbi:Aldo/keto reductase [Kockovaella imperatae]|uniref:Aldo/keto reductase n=1 Tax=Kockovaella imperatae TaxID=4999 RepID=A0A1Y1UP99_9TREE|nr:Aldo/keto reductase [Kockovaella imperatae]ORX39296.1 Aldo/keto reductase [Kockovaella imperatae]
MVKTPLVKLEPTGQQMPLVGLGLWQIPKDRCADAVYEAIKAGYRLLDGAGDYGNEREAGQGVQKAIDEGLVKREDLFITSKLWSNFHAEDKVEPACQMSLDLWGLDYFDLYHIHFPIAVKYVDPKVRYPPGWSYDGKGTIILEDAPIYKTWAVMESLVDKKKARNIGISNFRGVLISDLMTYARIPPAVLQVEMHPLLVQEQLIQLCKAYKIHITAYSSFGGPSYGPQPKIGSLFEEEHIVAAGKAHKKTPAQVLLRWSTQRDIAVIPKSNHSERLAENLACCDFDLTEKELKDITALDQDFRFNDPGKVDPRMAIWS